VERDDQGVTFGIRGPAHRRCAAAIPATEVVVFELTRHGEDRHGRRIFHFGQRHMAAAAEGNEQLTPERVVVGLAADERRAAQSPYCGSGRCRCLSGEIGILGSGLSITVKDRSLAIRTRESQGSEKAAARSRRQ
jgi:hypothetical protein